MGVTAALNITEGISHQTKTANMKFLLLTVFVAVAYATEEAAEEAKPEAPKAVVPVHPYYGLLGHQLQWPGVRLPGFSGTCWGCRGRRSAEADAEPGYYGLPYYGYPYGDYGYPIIPAVKSGYEHDLPGDSNVSVERTHLLGKRSAEPGYYGYGYYGYGYLYYHAVKPFKAGTAVHPGLATSFVERSPQGAKAKRSAEPGYYGYPYGYYGYPYLRYHALKPLKAGTAVHPGLATSFVETSGAAGK